MRVGVLAVQGAFAAHVAVLRQLGHDACELRVPSELDGVDGVVLPGGESTTQLLLLAESGLGTALDTRIRAGLPVLATCAGLILAAREVQAPPQPSFAWLDVVVARNAWGRQVHSFEATADPDAAFGALPLVFIRAPRILATGPEVQVLARFQGEPVLVRQGRFYAATFHPELSGESRVHAAVFGRG